MVCFISVSGLQMGRTVVEKHEFRDTLERTMRMVQLEVMLCIAGDFNEHVGVAEPGEEECVGKFGWETRNREGQELVEIQTQAGELQGKCAYHA